jgi:hypothetical protein
VQVRHGWSGEVAPNRWAKFDITLEEEDLRRLVGAGPGTLTLTTTLAYQLLEAEAERLVFDKLIRRYGYDRGDGMQKIHDLTLRLTTLKDQAWGRQSQTSDG